MKFFNYVVVIFVFFGVLAAINQIGCQQEEKVNFRADSKVCSDVIWVGTNQGLYIQYKSADDGAQPQKLKSKVRNIVDMVESVDPATNNTIVVTVWDGHKIQTVLVDEDGVFGATLVEQVNPAQWGKKKKDSQLLLNN
jgi:predicted membrane protein